MEIRNTDDYIMQSKKLLFRTLNCCESQIIPFQNAHDIENDELLKAVTGLAGGIYNRGSTCGVVFGAALDLALLRYKADWAPGDELALLYEVADYVDWFDSQFGGSLCRDRTELDFQTIRGKVGLLIPKKARGCVKQSALSMKYLLEVDGTDPQTCSAYDHCASDVLQKIREATGVGDKDIEGLVTVLDGGIGLSGGGCGALAGGIIALGLQYGNEHNRDDAFKIRNLLRTMPRKFSKNTSGLINKFEERYGSLECEGIIRRKLSDFDDFQKQRKECQTLIDWVISSIME